MDSNERFDQLESLLVDLARKVDQLDGAFARQSEAIARQSEAIARQEIRLDGISDQIGDIINILKLSEARHTETEQRQDALLVEIQRQGQRQDVAVEALKLLLKRQENADARLDGVVQAQLQTLQLMRVDADRLDGQEPRLKRLEDEVFREAS